MAEKHAFAKCKICGAYHAGVAHEWGNKPAASSVGNLVSDRQAPTVTEIRKATADLERAFPSDSRAKATNDKTEPKRAPRPDGVASRPSRRGGPPASITDPKAAASAQPTVAEDHPVAPQRDRSSAPPKLAGLQSLADAASARIAAKPKAGRPRVHADRKAYKAKKERERRAKAKA